MGFVELGLRKKNNESTFEKVMSFISKTEKNENSCSLTTVWPFPPLNGQIKMSDKQLD